MKTCRGIWIQEEKELLQEVAGMGELREPWHTKQVELLDRHLHLLHLYSQAKENLAAYKGNIDIHIYFVTEKLLICKLCYVKNNMLKLYMCSEN